MEEEKEEMSTTTTTVLLPPDILMDILSRFPVETLLNSFKFVCKAWRTIIKDPGFVNMHLNRLGGGVVSINGGGGVLNRNDNSNSSLYCKSGDTLYQLHPPFNCDDDGVPPPIASAKELDFDLVSSYSRLVGSCNGLLCIRDFVDRKNNIIILNPATRKYKVLPEEPKLESHGTWIISNDSVTYGFGCCYNNNDYEYKLVRVAYFYPVDRSYMDRPIYEFQIDIYSMSSNSWKRTREGIKDFPALIFKHRPAVFLNGALHWIGVSIHHHGFGGFRDVVIVSFDLRDEDYRRLIAMPSCVIDDDKPRDKILINLRGCLGIIFASSCWDFDIWVMKVYGIRESWTRECVIRSSNTDPLKALSGFHISWNVTACFLKGDQILIDAGYHGRMALYDMNSKKIDVDFKIVGVPYEDPIAGVNYKHSIQDLADYIETLVSPKSSHAAS